MKFMMIAGLLMISYGILADDQFEKPASKEFKAEWKMGEKVVFKIDPFYSKVCRNMRIPGMKDLKDDETVGEIDQYINGEYRVVKVACNSDRIYGYQHFDVAESDIVGRYMPPEVEKDEGWSWYWWLLIIGGAAVGVPLVI